VQVEGTTGAAAGAAARVVRRLQYRGGTERKEWVRKGGWHTEEARRKWERSEEVGGVEEARAWRKWKAQRKWEARRKEEGSERLGGLPETGGGCMVRAQMRVSQQYPPVLMHVFVCVRARRKEEKREGYSIIGEI